MKAPNWPKPAKTVSICGHCGTISNERMRRHQIALDTYRRLQQEEIINIKLSPDDSGLTVDHLLQVKKAMDRPRDREAVRQLEAIKKMGGEGSL